MGERISEVQTNINVEPKKDFTEAELESLRQQSFSSAEFDNLFGSQIDEEQISLSSVVFTSNFLTKIIRQANSQFSERLGYMPEAINWLNEHPQQFFRDVVLFNRLTKHAGVIRQELANDKMFKNTGRLYKAIGTANIPFNHLFTFFQFTDEQNSESSLALINNHMEHGEMKRGKPKLTFHQETQNPEAIIFGGLFHMYEKQILYTRYNWQKFIDDGVIIGSLIEALANDPKLKDVWNLVSSPEGLNWVDHNHQLHPDFRKAQGFS